MRRRLEIAKASKLFFAGLAATIAVSLVILITLFARFASHQISLERESLASHVLILVLDSRNPDDAGLPDSLTIMNLTNGSIQSIPRDWQLSRMEPSKSLVEKHLGIKTCDPFCTIQGVYAFTKLNSPGSSKEELALGKLVDVIEFEYQIPSLGIIVMDLNWVFSFLHRIGKVQLKVKEPIPVGGIDVNGTYYGVERYLSRGLAELKGEDLYWFARARFGSSNESRMARQRELISAISQQINLPSLSVAALSAKGQIKLDLDPGEVIRFLLTIPKLRAG